MQQKRRHGKRSRQIKTKKGITVQMEAKRVEVIGMAVCVTSRTRECTRKEYMFR